MRVCAAAHIKTNPRDSANKTKGAPPVAIK